MTAHAADATPSATVTTPVQLVHRALLAGMTRVGDIALLVLLIVAARQLGSRQFGLFMFGLTLASVIVIPVLESFMPIVATRVGGVPELVTDQVEGLLVAPQDPADLAQGIVRILTDSALAHCLGEAGRRAGARFSVTEHVNALQRFYAGVVS